MSSFKFSLNYTKLAKLVIKAYVERSNINLAKKGGIEPGTLALWDLLCCILMPI